jgi:hypothetical protein
VEGPIRAGQGDALHHALQIIEDVASSNPQRLETSIEKHSIARPIALRAVAH